MATDGRYTLTIPNWHPARLNELIGANVGKRGRLKREAANMLGTYAVAHGIPRGVTCKRRVGLTICLKPRCRGGDPDSYYKTLLDGLVQAWLLVDDSRQWCELLPVRFERRPDWWGTEIVLEDVTGQGQAGERSAR